MTAKSDTPAGITTGIHYSAPALEKGIDVLELLGVEPSGLTISAIAMRLSRSISELFRVVVVLERRGWLHKEAASAPTVSPIACSNSRTGLRQLRN